MQKADGEEPACDPQASSKAMLFDSCLFHIALFLPAAFRGLSARPYEAGFEVPMRNLTDAFHLIGTGSPFRYVGSNLHCPSAFIAALYNSGGPDTTFMSTTLPWLSIIAEIITSPCIPA
jgi:hypothetical protein